MRKWAKKQRGTNIKDMFLMGKNINEFWLGTDCILCEKYGELYTFEKGCEKCPLFFNGFGCLTNNSAWEKMNVSKTWAEWIINATEMARVIMKLPREE